MYILIYPSYMYYVSISFTDGSTYMYMYMYNVHNVLT